MIDHALEGVVAEVRVGATAGKREKRGGFERRVRAPTWRIFASKYSARSQRS